jgi:hypothetical protein
MARAATEPSPYRNREDGSWPKQTVKTRAGTGEGVGEALGTGEAGGVPVDGGAATGPLGLLQAAREKLRISRIRLNLEKVARMLQLRSQRYKQRRRGRCNFKEAARALRLRAKRKKFGLALSGGQTHIKSQVKRPQRGLGDWTFQPIARWKRMQNLAFVWFKVQAKAGLFITKFCG